jgi:hypothetical protein
MAFLTGDANDNFFFCSLDVSDAIDGFGGNDTASCNSGSAVDGPVRVDLGLTVAQNSFGSRWDPLISIETLIGSSFSGTQTDDNANNLIEGGKGADLITRSRGADRLADGSDGDCFRYLTVAESENSPNLCDRTLAFNPAEPKECIDVSAIDANSLLPGNQAVVYGRTTASVDFSMRLDGVSFPMAGYIRPHTAGHFIL